MSHPHSPQGRNKFWNRLEPTASCFMNQSCPAIPGHLIWDLWAHSTYTIYGSTHQWATTYPGSPQSYTPSGLVTQPHSPVTGRPCTRQVLATKQTRGQPYLPDQDKMPEVELCKLELGNLPNKEFKVITVKILKVIRRIFN